VTLTLLSLHNYNTGESDPKNGISVIQQGKKPVEISGKLVEEGIYKRQANNEKRLNSVISPVSS
jgi:hypothetical protein